MPDITLSYLKTSRTYTDLSTAQNRVRVLLGHNPSRISKDGINSRFAWKGDTVVYFRGCSYEELCPPTCDLCHQKGPVSFHRESEMVLCSRCNQKIEVSS